MAYTRELNTNFNFANIDIYNVLNDGVLSFYEARPQEGYVVYDIKPIAKDAVLATRA